MVVAVIFSTNVLNNYVEDDGGNFPRSFHKRRRRIPFVSSCAVSTKVSETPIRGHHVGSLTKVSS